MDPRPWNLLDVGSIWMKEFASALSRQTPTISWSPVMSWLGAFEDWERTEQIAHPPLRVTYYPLQRGYARRPIRSIFPFEDRLIKRLLAHSEASRQPALVCSTPFYAPVAEKWPGPVVYYVTDFTAGYAGIDPAQVISLDKRMCRVAHSVCPNSRRIAAYLAQTAGCDPAKLTVVPNATRESNIAAQPLLRPGALPASIADLPRPIVGVIGNLAANMDWELLAAAVKQTEALRWVFVGPYSMPVPDPAQREARAWVMAHARFTGAKPYGELQEYARCFDVAVLPYRKVEPTYSGSSTRFYEHLAACRPMLATRGFAELLEKEPLVELVDTASALCQALGRLQAIDFDDGLQGARWDASRTGTWEQRARTLLGTVQHSTREVSG